MQSDERTRLERASAYLGTLLRRRPEYAAWLWDDKNLHRRYGLMDLFSDLSRELEAAGSFHEALLAFRVFKQRHFLRIGGRDLLGWASLEETTCQLADLAEVCLQTGLDWLKTHPELWISAVESPHARMDFRRIVVAVIGLGKFGGRELNYVSDVDLLFLRPDEPKERLDEPRAEAAVLLCQRLTRLLADNVDGDRVFHVDLRLRPQGKDGELVPTAGGAAYHYLLHGRAWERQMLLKARPVAGDRGLGSAFIKEVRPFVFRRFLDFQALDELKAMRDRILQETRARSSRRFDVKLGVGGIREVEFLVQSFQLIYGGRHPQLDEPNTLAALGKLRELGLLPEETAAELEAAYRFLRRVEHWIQLDANRRTQTLPVSRDARRRLAEALGFRGDWDRFQETLDKHCKVVHTHFSALFASPDSPRTSRRHPGREPACRLPSLSRFSAEFSRSVEDVLDSMAASLREEEIQTLCARLDRYLSQVRRRPGLRTFLDSGHGWMPAFLSALARSDLVANLLEAQPSLVETFAHWERLNVSHSAWEKEAAAILSKTPGYEERLEWIRRLKNERQLLIAVAELAEEWSTEEVERELTLLADFVIAETYKVVCSAMGLAEPPSLAVAALGTLGSGEMNILSDLDLVFIYEPSGGEPPDQIPVPVVRFMHRFMRMLTTPLQEGPGYAVDARLRPTGSYGPLAVTRASWEDYYAHKADIWEVQALLRFRPVVGPEELRMELEDKARMFCYRERSPSQVWPRLCELRTRMEKERASEKADQVDVKLGSGGLADLEFLVQGLQLIHGWRDADLRFGNVRRALEAAVRYVTDDGEVRKKIRNAFDVLRTLEHRLHLMTRQSGTRLTRSRFDALVRWRHWPTPHNPLLVESWEDLLALRRFVRRWWDGCCGT